MYRFENTECCQFLEEAVDCRLVDQYSTSRYNLIGMAQDILWRKITVGFFRANCYIIIDKSQEEGVVVDPGSDLTRILGVLEYLPVRKIRYIILTHGHIDHIRAVDDLKRVTGAKVALHRAEVSLYLNPVQNFSLFTLRPFYPGPPDILLNDGDELMIGDKFIRIFHTPGHSPGGIVARIENLLITGDTLLYRSVGNTWVPGSNRKTLLKSIKRIVRETPDDVLVLPGHGRVAWLSRIKKINPFVREAVFT